MLDSYSSEDKSDTEYKIELEISSSSEESEEYSKSKRNCRGQRKSKKQKREIWEEDDEIIVLTQLYEFSGKNGSYSNPFYEFVKKRLRNKKVSMKQMSIKIDGLKKEYLENECRRKQNPNLQFSDRHQWRLFVLSKRIWGGHKDDDSNNNNMKKSKGFMDYLQEMDIDINTLNPSSLEFLRKEWDVQLLMYIQLLSNKSKFDAKLMALTATSPTHNNTI